jgi:hypothetical protein
MSAVLRTLTTPSDRPPPIVALPATGTLARAALDGTLNAHAQAGVAIPAAETTR